VNSDAPLRQAAEKGCFGAAAAQPLAFDAPGMRSRCVFVVARFHA
jgi:hypothetical protein